MQNIFIQLGHLFLNSDKEHKKYENVLSRTVGEKWRQKMYSGHKYKPSLKRPVVSLYLVQNYIKMAPAIVLDKSEVLFHTKHNRTKPFTLVSRVMLWRN